MSIPIKKKAKINIIAENINGNDRKVDTTTAAASFQSGHNFINGAQAVDQQEF